MTKVLKFSADFCVPCKTLQKTINEIKPNYPDVDIQEIDIEENDEMVNEYKIQSIPTLIFIKDDKIISRISGSCGKDKLVEMFNELKE